MFRIVDLEVRIPNPNYQLNIDSTTTQEYITGKYPVILPNDLYVNMYGNNPTYAPTSSYEPDVEQSIASILRKSSNSKKYVDLTKYEETYNVDKFKKFVDKIISLSKMVTVEKFYLKYEEDIEDSDIINNIEVSLVQYLYDNNLLFKILNFINDKLPNDVRVYYIAELSSVYVIRYYFDKNLPNMKESLKRSIKVITFVEKVIQWAVYCSNNMISEANQTDILYQFVTNESYYQYFQTDQSSLNEWRSYRLKPPMVILYEKLNREKRMYICRKFRENKIIVFKLNEI